MAIAMVLVRRILFLHSGANIRSLHTSLPSLTAYIAPVSDALIQIKALSTFDYNALRWSYCGKVAGIPFYSKKSAIL
jgi:hypothetical protein